MKRYVCFIAAFGSDLAKDTVEIIDAPSSLYARQIKAAKHTAAELSDICAQLITPPYRTGDNRRFYNLADAQAHAEKVYAARGKIIAVDYLPK